MKKIFPAIGLLLLLAFALPLQTVQAQETARVVGTTLPVSPELRTAVDAWLAASPPSSAVYYGITYTQPLGYKHYVCIVGLIIATPRIGYSGSGCEARWFSQVSHSIFPSILRSRRRALRTFPMAAIKGGANLGPEWSTWRRVWLSGVRRMASH